MTILNSNQEAAYLTKMMQNAINSTENCTEDRIPDLSVHKVHLGDNNHDKMHADHCQIVLR